MFARVSAYIRTHKKLAVFILCVLLIGGYVSAKKLGGEKTETRQVLASVEKGTLTVSLSASGQVLTSNQIDIKSEVAGKVTSINVKNGQTVKEGTVLAQLNAKDAQKAVRDARISLQTAQLSLQKLKKPAESLALLQAENAIIDAKNDLEKLKDGTGSSTSLLQAQTSLDQAKNDLEKLKLTQENSYIDAVNAKQKAEDNIAKGYEDAFNTVADVFLDLPTLVESFYDILYSDEIVRSEPSVAGGGRLNTDALFNGIDYHKSEHRNVIEDLQHKAEKSYEEARVHYDLALKSYTAASRYSDTATIETLLDQTLATVKSFAELAKNEANYLSTWEDYRTLEDKETFGQVNEYQTNLASYISTTNAQLLSVLSADRALVDNADEVKSSERNLKEIEQNNPFALKAQETTIKEKELALTQLKTDLPIQILLQEQVVKEKEQALADLKKGPDTFDLRSQELSVLQRQTALSDAQEKLADASIKAPFDGVIAGVSIKKGDSLSSGATVFTFIAKQYIAEISLNEVDVSKVALGQKVILTFDAIENLSLTGQVAEIDTLGTVTQGVVNYTLKIAFDTQDERIKPGMSVSTVIITDVAQDILIVPTAAIKSAGGIFYVETPAQVDLDAAGAEATEVLQTQAPIQRTVTIGLASDTQTQVTGDIKEGDKIISRTITTGGPTTAPTNATQQRSLFSVPGGAGGAARPPGGANFVR